MLILVLLILRFHDISISNQRSLFETDAYKELSLSDAIDMIMPHSWVEYDSETAGLDPIQNHYCVLSMV